MRLGNGTIERLQKLINKNVAEDLKRSYPKHQNLICDRRYIKKEILVAQ